MPPNAKGFSSHFASSDEEQNNNSPHVQTESRHSKKASNYTDDGNPVELVQKPIAPRRGGRPRGSKSGTGESRVASTRKVTAVDDKGNRRSIAKQKERARDLSSHVHEGEIEESDTHAPNEDEGELGDVVFDASMEEMTPPDASHFGSKRNSRKTIGTIAKDSGVKVQPLEGTELPSQRDNEKNAELEKLTLKYNKLLTLRSTEAETALSDFKANMKHKDIASEKLIATLTSEVKIASERSAKSQELQEEVKRATLLLQEKEKQLTAQKTAFERLQRENEHLQSKSLFGRTQAQAGNNSKSLNQPPAFREVSSLKEELYGDLSGLIIRGIQEDNEGLIVYDCLQTGRNGTLHFKLSVSSAALSNRSDGYNSADSEITFTPLLDAQDKVLERVLPDYLKEEITFPREKASSFYLRLANALQNVRGTT